MTAENRKPFRNRETCVGDEELQKASGMQTTVAWASARYLRPRMHGAHWKGKEQMRTEGRPTSLWARLKARYSDNLGPGRR